MYSRDEILRSLDDIQRDSAAYWSAFPRDEFFAKIGEAWSPADNVRHLAKSIRPVTKALRLPRFVLRLMFGAPKHASRTYDALLEFYRSKLTGGNDAGRFAPSPRAFTDPSEVLALQEQANRELRAAIERWPEKALDRYQLPHPLMGKLTVREMLFFTLYHQLHHMDGVKRRKSA
ncbi:MAG TPA: DinB family protein [Thermoanaerobaculia bacterium]|nr:DinB family protein [Thermoanaerobaculia bacterium]